MIATQLTIYNYTIEPQYNQGRIEPPEAARGHATS